MSLQTLKHLRQLRTTLLGAKTTANAATHGAHAASQLRDLVVSVSKLIGRVDERLEAEAAALDEPHAFVPGRRPLWCARCGATEDRHRPPAPMMAPCEAARGR